MSVLYRAVWSAPTTQSAASTIEAALLEFSRWALDDDLASPLEPGEHVAGSRRISVRHASDGSLVGLGCETRDQSVVGGVTSTWVTRVNVVAGEDSVHVWVDNDMETENLTQRIKIGRPRVVEPLLSVGGVPVLDGVAVRADVVEVPPEGVKMLVDLLRSESRTLPIIVFTEDAEGSSRWREWAGKVARRAAGVATVVALGRPAVMALRSELGDLSVWGGGSRTYVPAPLEGSSDGWRHRYVPFSRLAEAETSAIDRIVYNVAQLSTRRRVPDVFSLLHLATTAEVTRADLDALEELLEVERDERMGVERELAQTAGHLERLIERLRSRGLDEHIWLTEPGQVSGVSMPDTASDVTEAVLIAQAYLDTWLELPDSAVRDLDALDTAPNSSAWGNTTLRGLRALHAYARDKAEGGFTGDFWAWCESGRPPGGWPATSKKLAMRESDTVRTRDKYRQARVFRVAPEVESSGELFMEAHLKISEGGGSAIPRVYFYDDTDGATGKVHIGFVGPHGLLPNTRT